MQSSLADLTLNLDESKVDRGAQATIFHDTGKGLTLKVFCNKESRRENVRACKSHLIDVKHTHLLKTLGYHDGKRERKNFPSLSPDSVAFMVQVLSKGCRRVASASDVVNLPAVVTKTYFSDLGTLRTKLATSKGGTFEEQDKAKNVLAKLKTKDGLLDFARGGLSALLAMHAAGYIHWDIDEGNILFGDTASIFVIADFGFSRRPISKAEKFQNMCLSMVSRNGHSRTEWESHCRHTHPSNDFFEFGIVLSAVCSEARNFESSYVKAILDVLLSPDPKDRGTKQIENLLASNTFEDRRRTTLLRLEGTNGTFEARRGVVADTSEWHGE
jgi:hypothetical protein